MKIARLVGHALRGPWGDPSLHLPRATLDPAIDALSPPRDEGEIGLIVVRRDDTLRETPDRVSVAPDTGIPGDAWARDCPTHFDSQIAIMRLDLARLYANGQPLTLFGDNLLVDLDLSTDNLPAGSRLLAGTALLEVTPEPHNGCMKFRKRFGKDALLTTAAPERRRLRLRGIYAKVVQAGEIARGDRIAVVARPEVV